MKRFYLIAALLSMTLMANAQLQDTGKSLTERYQYVTPRQFTYGSKLFIYTMTKEGDGENMKTTFTIYNDDIEKIHSFVASGDIEDPDFMNYDEYSGPEEGFRISQTLFNTDEKYEYIRYEYENNSEEKPHGFSIVQEDGTILQTIRSTNEISNVAILKLNGKLYLDVAEIIGEDSNWGYILTDVFYRIDQKANSIKRIDTPMGMVVRPAIADRNEQITVDLDSDAREIQVVNAAGQTVKRIPVGEGERQVTFNTRGLGSGVNVVRATGRNRQASSKFIVK